jgi:hypothetical protein
MFRKLQVTAILFCMLSYATAGTVSIGTASARGEMHVDSYAVNGNATLFDGSVVQTGKATADLRLNKGTAITLSTDSRGKLFSDHLVLQQGEGEVVASTPFQLEANGLRVIPNDPNSRGVVSLKAGNTVEVASLNGSFGVTNGHGILLANVRPGRVVTFAMQAGASPNEFAGVGLISIENGTYYLTTDSGAKYVLSCRDFKKYAWNKVVVSGTVQGTGASGVLCVKTIDVNGSEGMSTGKKWLIAGIIVGLGAGLGIGLALSNNSAPAASR